MNLTNGATFPTSLFKRARSRINQKIKSPRDTKRCIREIVINNGCNKQIVQILREKRDGKFIFKENFLSRLTNPV